MYYSAWMALPLEDGITVGRSSCGTYFFLLFYPVYLYGLSVRFNGRKNTTLTFASTFWKTKRGAVGYADLTVMLRRELFYFSRG